MSSKRKINEYCQQNGHTSSGYTIISKKGPPHNPVFVVEYSGKYPTRKEAENDAALNLFKYINRDESEKEMGDESEDEQPPATVLIDGDNVHGALEWVIANRKKWTVHLFVNQSNQGGVGWGGSIYHKVHIHRCVSTDIAKIIFVMRYLPRMDNNKTLILVSRDKIFQIFEEEIGDNRISTAQTIGELELNEF